LAAPNNQPLEVGFYDNVARYPFQTDDQPGFDFHGDGRGNNTLCGSFEILEIAFDPDGNLERLAVDFTQYGSELPDMWLTGQFRYNSDIPISSVPIPAGIWLLGSGCAVLMGLKKKHKRLA
jgi:hypothetical protein